MKKKIVGILVCMVLVVTAVLPAIGTTNVDKTREVGKGTVGPNDGPAFVCPCSRDIIGQPVNADGPDNCPEEMISYWKADGDANDYYGSNDGIYYGTGYVSGQVDQAFSFDGVDDFVRIPHDSSLNLGTGDFTLEAWIKYDGPTDGSVMYPAIMSKRPAGTDPNGGFGFYLSYWSGATLGTLFLRIDDMNYILCSTPVDDGYWHHVAVTRSNGTLIFYVDGVVDGTATSNKDASSNADLRFGLDDSSSFETAWKGNLDEIAIYNECLAGFIIAHHHILGLYKCGYCDPLPIGALHNASLDYIFSHNPQDGDIFLPENDFLRIVDLVKEFLMEEGYPIDIVDNIADECVNLYSEMDWFFEIDNEIFYGHPVVTDDYIEYKMNYLVDQGMTTEAAASEVIKIAEMIWDRLDEETVLSYVESLPDMNWDAEEQLLIDVFVDVFIHSHDYWTDEPPFLKTNCGRIKGENIYGRWGAICGVVAGDAVGAYEGGKIGGIIGTLFGGPPGGAVGTTIGAIIVGGCASYAAYEAAAIVAPAGEDPDPLHITKPQYVLLYGDQESIEHTSIGNGALDISFRDLEVYNTKHTGSFGVTQDLGDGVSQYECHMYPGRYGYWNPNVGAEVEVEFTGMVEDEEQLLGKLKREKIEDDKWECLVNVPDVTNYQIKGYFEDELIFESNISGDGWVSVGSSIGDGEGYIWLPGPDTHPWDWELDLTILGSTIPIFDFTFDYFPTPNPLEFETDYGIYEVNRVSVIPQDYPYDCASLIEITISGSNIPYFTIQSVSIGENNAPNTPSITGPTSGKAKEEYSYTISTIDLDENDVYYYIDWGDETNSGWLGPYSSGESTTASHIWDEQGTYIVKAKAKDTNGAMSNWATLEVSMPKNKAINTPFLQFLENLLQSHLHLFPILQQLLRLGI